MPLFQSVRIHRERRLFASGSPVLFAGGVALAGLAVASLSKGISLDHVAVWVLFFLWIVLLLFFESVGPLSGECVSVEHYTRVMRVPVFASSRGPVLPPLVLRSIA